MEYKAYKLKFQSAVHFGKMDLDDSTNTFYADTLFSALYIEALKAGEKVANDIFDAFLSGKLVVSDAMPFLDKTYFLPKPMIHIEGNAYKKTDSAEKKAYKKLSYIPAEQFENYLKGDFDVMKYGKVEKDIGTYSTQVRASINDESDTLPYYVELFNFFGNSGLYIIIGYADKEVLYRVEDLLLSLQYSGIGGKRYSGCGRFELIMGNSLPDEILSRLCNRDGKQMTLSISLPKDTEIEKAFEGAEYQIIKRSGFVQSDAYSERPIRKKDLYMIKSGACFSNKYSGSIYDVSENKGLHPVYRYGIPLFMGVNL